MKKKKILKIAILIVLALISMYGFVAMGIFIGALAMLEFNKLFILGIVLGAINGLSVGYSFIENLLAWGCEE